MKKLIKSLLLALTLTVVPVTAINLTAEDNQQQAIEVKDNDSSGTMAVPGGNGGSGGGG